jgi:hypothetical protein
MKKLYIPFIFVFLFCINQVNSQQLFVEGGKSLTVFEFEDSQGENLGNLQGTSQSYVSLGYRKNVVNNVLHVVLGTGIHSYGAIGSDDTVNNFFEWETTYLDLFTGIDVRLYNKNKFAFYLRGTAAAEFLLQGSQTLNSQVFNLVGEEDFDKPNYFVRAGTVLEYELSESLSVYFQYKYGKSLQKLKVANGQSELGFKSHDIGFGLFINL